MLPVRNTLISNEIPPLSVYYVRFASMDMQDKICNIQVEK